MEVKWGFVSSENNYP